MTTDATGTGTIAADDGTGSVIERVERFYLVLLRSAVLLIATSALLWAAWLGVSALYKIARSPDSIVEQPADVQAAELASAITPAAVKAHRDGEKADVPASQRAFYNDFVSRYYSIYKNKFEPFRQPDDKRLSKDEFDDSLIKSTERIAAIAQGENDFAKDSAALNGLLATVTAAADLPQTKSRLEAYRSAKKQTVQRKVQRFRIERRRGWDSSSMDCANWYTSPVGCAVVRNVSIPYTETVNSTALPDGLMSPTQVIRTMQDRYFFLREERARTNAAAATAERDAIVMGNATGWNNLHLMMMVLGGFLVLMFFFLLIAIERHHRRLVTQR